MHTAGILWHPRSLSEDPSIAAVCGRLKCALLNLLTAFELTISLPREEGSIPVVCTSFAFVFRGLPFILPHHKYYKSSVAFADFELFCLVPSGWLITHHSEILCGTSCLPVNPKPCVFKRTERICMRASSHLSLSACLQRFLAALLAVYYIWSLLKFCFDSETCNQSVSYMSPKKSRRIF